MPSPHDLLDLPDGPITGLSLVRCGLTVEMCQDAFDTLFRIASVIPDPPEAVADRCRLLWACVLLLRGGPEMEVTMIERRAGIVYIDLGERGHEAMVQRCNALIRAGGDNPMALYH